jgi:hypothetical protein
MATWESTINMAFYKKGICMRAQCHGLSLIVFSFPFPGWMDEEGVQITKRETNPKQTPRSIYATTTRARV